MDTTREDSDSIDWNTDDELDIEGISSSSSCQGSIDIPSTSYGCSGSNVINQFVLMGFPKQMVLQAIKLNGENDLEVLLEVLLTYSAIEKSPKEEANILDDPSSDKIDSSILDYFSDEEIFTDEESTDPLVEKDKIVSHLVEMGYKAEEASIAIDRCGIDTPMAELIEFIDAAQMAYDDRDLPIKAPTHKKEFRWCRQIKKDKKRKLDINEQWKLKKDEGLIMSKKSRYLGKKPTDHDDEVLNLPKPMIGFGVSNASLPVIRRRLPDEAEGPPYFYFENVAFTPKGVWSTISRFLYGIDPEFVDSKFFCAAARKRGYIHNLPIHNRCPLHPKPPRNIHEAFPHLKNFWPCWDLRTKLNCLLTCVASAKLTDGIKKKLDVAGDKPSLNVRKSVLEQCKKWNLIWVGKNKVAPLEPNEIEMLMGFPSFHTRGGGTTRTEQYRVLGNSFQVDTVAYHLSVLKDMFPNGLNVLSLFSGIGGAEVALHGLGIPMKNVVSVEISDTCRKILQHWWEQTNQQGKLIHFPDIRDVTVEILGGWISELGGFDLVIGGSPCNNLAGRNRVSRDGLEGTHSSLFYDYFRIIDLVRFLVRNRV